MRRLTVLLASLADTAPHRSVGELVHWAAHDRQVRVEVVAMHGGPQLAPLARSARVHVVNDPGASRVVDALQTVRLGLVAEQARRRDLRRRLADLDAVWLADLEASRLLHWAGPARTVTAHQHGSAARPELDADDRAVLVERVERGVAGSPVAATVLAELTGLPAAKVARRADLLDRTRQWADPVGGRSARRLATRRVLATEHHIPSSGPLVVSSGRVDFGHGSNPFARRCWELHLAQPRLGIQFAWLAGHSTERMLTPLRRDIERAGLATAIHVVIDGPPSLEVLLAADCYLHTDSAPLDPELADDLGAMGVPVVDLSAGPTPSTHRWPRQDAVPGEVIDWREVLLATLTRGPSSDDDRADWDVRFGGPALLASLLG